MNYRIKQNQKDLERHLFNTICERQAREIELIDARPSMLGGSFRRMNMSQTQYYLTYSKNTAKKKRELRQLAGFFKYYFYYTYKLITAYNAYYYTRP
jgi:hypothetical protein